MTSHSDHVDPQDPDTALYSEDAAHMLRKCSMAVLLAPSDEKLTTFMAATQMLADAAADGWLPKRVVADRLQNTAEAHLNFGLSTDEIQHIMASAMGAAEAAKERARQAVAEAAAAARPPVRRLIAHRASELEPEKLVWIWPGRIPEGKLVLLGGPPGLGKSQLTAFMAATVSTGGHWPCGEGTTQVGDVIFMSAEDGTRDTIIPRLMAAGADRERVHIVEAATKPDGTGRKTFSLKTDVDLLEQMAREIGTVRLIVVDPISAYLGGGDGNGNAETRELLEPLADMANRLRIAVVAVNHLNKGGAGQQSPLNRFAGSIAFIAAARAAFAVIEDPDDKDRRLLLQAKNNLGSRCQGLAFRIEQRIVGDGVLSSNVMFESEPVSITLDEALPASEGRGRSNGRSTKDEAADFLRTILADGAVPVLRIEAEARAAGLLAPDKPISQHKPFRAARDLLGITPQRRGGTGAGGQWVWEIPGAAKDDPGTL